MAAPGFDLRTSQLETLQSAAAATGNGTAITMDGFGPLTLDITGTFVGTITFEGSTDGTNYFTVGLLLLSAGTYSTTATTAVPYAMPPHFPPLATFRARVSAYTSGTITVKARKAARFSQG